MGMRTGFARGKNFNGFLVLKDKRRKSNLIVNLILTATGKHFCSSYIYQEQRTEMNDPLRMPFALDQVRREPLSSDFFCFARHFYIDIYIFINSALDFSLCTVQSLNYQNWHAILITSKSDAEEWSVPFDWW